MFVKQVFRLVTSFVGGYMLTGGVDHFILRFGWKDNAPLDPAVFFTSPQTFHCTETLCYVLGGVWFVLFITGALVQFCVTGPHLQKQEDIDHAMGHALDLRQPLVDIQSDPRGNRSVYWS